MLDLELMYVQCLKGDAGNPILNAKSKIYSAIFSASNAMDQKESPNCHNFPPVIPNYHIKVTYIYALYAEKIAEASLLNVLRIKLPASLLQKLQGTDQYNS